MNERIENLLYRSGLTAQGCWGEMDEYCREAIIRLVILTVDESCGAIEDYKTEPWPFNEDVAISVIKERFSNQ